MIKMHLGGLEELCRSFKYLLCKHLVISSNPQCPTYPKHGTGWDLCCLGTTVNFWILPDPPSVLEISARGLEHSPAHLWAGTEAKGAPASARTEIWGGPCTSSISLSRPHLPHKGTEVNRHQSKGEYSLRRKTNLSKTRLSYLLL